MAFAAASLLSTASRRLLARRGHALASAAVARHSAAVVVPVATSIRSLSATADFTQFREQGIVDDDNLIQFDTLHEMQTRSCLVYEKRELFGTYSAKSNQFEWMTFKEYGDKVDQCRAMLKDLGIQANDKIGLISNNRWEWATIAAAAYSLNANIVPMYEAQLPADWIYIVNDSACKVLFCATQDIFDRVQTQVLPNTSSVQATLCFDGPADEEYTFENALGKFKADTAGALIEAPMPTDLADLIYTSGTTGKPKGVELTHLNITSNVLGAARTMVTDPHDFIRETDRSLAFLPWAHSYGQTCELWMFMSHGAGMGISRGIPVILEDLQHVKPSVLFAVPTLYKKIYDGVHNLMETSSPIRKKLMKRALELGRRKVESNLGVAPAMSFAESIQHKLLDSIVLSKIRARFGGNLRQGFVAGAACPAEVLSFMDDIGIPICEGYGLTETSPIIAINTPEQRHVGSVGRAIGGVKVYIMEDGKEVPIGEEGEICCTGPNVMRGYYNKPEETEKVISIAPDGKSRMFHTGDLGRVDENGFISVTGRLKEQYKLENGKYVVPTPIEEAIGMSRFIMQCVLAGANRPYNICLIVPDWAAIRTAIGVDDSVSEDDLANDERVKELIDHEIDANCARIKKFEIPKAWAFVAPFTAANDMLTPKMSIRRHKVIHSYAEVISHLYGDDPVVAPAADSQGAKEHPEHRAAA
jgi:long-chain acyl-CoA synthetase